MNSELFNQIVTGVILASVLGLIVYLRPFVNKLLLVLDKQIITVTGGLYDIEDAASIAIKAVEQMKLNGTIEKSAQAAKEEAIKITEQILRDRGLFIDVRSIEAAIESRIYQEFTLPKLEKSEESK